MRRWALVVALQLGGCLEARAAGTENDSQAATTPKPAPPILAPPATATELAATELVRRAQSDADRGRLSGAARHYFDALALQPGHVAALVGLAELRARQGDIAEARQLLTRAARLHDGAAANDALADLALNQGDLPGAQMHLEAAVQKEEDPARLTRLGHLYIKTRAYPAALGIWRCLLRHKPGDADTQLQVLALQELTGSLDPVLAGAQTDNWVRRTMAKLALRSSSGPS